MMLRKLAATAAAGVVAGGLMLAGTATATGQDETGSGFTPHEDCEPIQAFQANLGGEDTVDGTADVDAYEDLAQAIREAEDGDPEITAGEVAAFLRGCGNNDANDNGQADCPEIAAAVEANGEANVAAFIGVTEGELAEFLRGCGEPPASEPDPDPDPTTDPPATTEPTDDPTDDPTDGQGGGTGDGDDLPKTSGLTVLPLLLIGGGLLLASGVAALTMTRRRRVTLG